MGEFDLSPQLKAAVLQFVRNQSVDGRIRAMILDLVNQALRVQGVQLSNTDKDALTHETMKQILLDMLSEFQEPFSRN